VSEVYLNTRRVDFRELHRSEYRAKSLERVIVHFVRLLCANRRLRVVLDKKIRHSLNVRCSPLRTVASVLLSLACSRFAQLPLRVLPVFCMRRFQAAATGTVPVAHPPDTAVIASIYNSVMFTRLAKSTSCFESCSEGLKIRFQKPDIAAHHAEMGNLLSLNPKIHRLRADSQVGRSIADSERKVFSGERGQGRCVQRMRCRK